MTFTATINDRMSFALPSQRVVTDEGYLRVPAHAARTGVQEYLARELGIKDGNPDRIVKVYRPAEEVFATDSLASYAGADVTDDHPPTLVDSTSYSKYTRGTIIGEGVQDGDFVKVNMLIKSKDAIESVQSGKVQVSVGYTAQYDSNVPEDLKSQGIEFIQRDIKVNHVALVDRARAGAQARIFDGHKEGIKMTTVVLDSEAGRSVEIEDKASATLISDTLATLRKRVADAEAAQAKAEAEKEKMDEDLEEEKKKSSDAAIAARVKAIAETKDAASKIAGKDFTCDSLDPLEIKRAALAAKRPKVAWADKNAEYVAAAFDLEAEREEEDEDETKKESSDSYKLLTADIAAGGTKDAEPSPRQKAMDSMRTAHKKEVK